MASRSCRQRVELSRGQDRGIYILSTELEDGQTIALIRKANAALVAEVERLRRELDEAKREPHMERGPWKGWAQPAPVPYDADKWVKYPAVQLSEPTGATSECRVVKVGKPKKVSKDKPPRPKVMPWTWVDENRPTREEQLRRRPAVEYVGDDPLPTVRQRAAEATRTRRESERSNSPVTIIRGEPVQVAYPSPEPEPPTPTCEKDRRRWPKVEPGPDGGSRKEARPWGRECGDAEQWTAGLHGSAGPGARGDVIWKDGSRAESGSAVHHECDCADCTATRK